MNLNLSFSEFEVVLLRFFLPQTIKIANLAMIEMEVFLLVHEYQHDVQTLAT